MSEIQLHLHINTYINRSFIMTPNEQRSSQNELANENIASNLRARELVGLNHWTNHDIRRTFETGANRLNLSTYTLNKLINYKNSQDITGRYIVLEIDELREPMNQISQALWNEMK